MTIKKLIERIEMSGKDTIVLPFGISATLTKVAKID